MKDLTLKQITDLKYAMDSQLRSLVENEIMEFKKITGVQVSGFNVEFIHTSGSDVTHALYRFSTQVDFGI